jgi:hypothetical protein
VYMYTAVVTAYRIANTHSERRTAAGRDRG